MPDRRGNRPPRHSNQGQQQGQQGQQQGQPFPAQDEHNSIPFYNARLFAMYESLIQSYTHFTYHSNHMFHVLERALHGTQNSINSNPYPWLMIPHPPQQTQQPRQTQQPHQSYYWNYTQPTQPTQPQPQPQPTHAWRSADMRSPPPPPLRTPLENNIVNALMGMLYPPEEPRLTPAELNERIEEFEQFQNIERPLNTVCSITQDTFEPTQRVARIRHCGHIFSPDSLMEWLRNHNTCPTCRHNLRTSNRRAPTTTIPTTAAPTTTTTTTATTATPTTSTTTTRPLHRGISIPLESEININTFYNELLRNSGNLPGFELNTVNDDSIVFSFDLMSRPGASGPAPAQAPGPRNIDDVD